MTSRANWIALLVGAALVGGVAGIVSVQSPGPSRAPGDPHQTLGSAPTTGHFVLCHSGGGTNCVVDGDTVWMNGVTIRLADIDAPETHPPRCAHEAALGNKETERLRELLNLGAVTAEISGRSQDRYGHQLRILARDGQSLGGILVSEGLARAWDGARRPWC